MKSSLQALGAAQLPNNTNHLSKAFVITMLWKWALHIFICPIYQASLEFGNADNHMLTSLQTYLKSARILVFICPTTQQLVQRLTSFDVHKHICLDHLSYTPMFGQLKRLNVCSSLKSPEIILQNVYYILFCLGSFQQLGQQLMTQHIPWCPSKAKRISNNILVLYSFSCCTSV